MNDEVVCRFSTPRRVSRARRCGAFSLVELLTVMFIISALIAILVPSL
ncbi:MAG: prepilin-type N-terminal cleavage/methylation domain-containing protein, partial [Planctomycetes bacterium]|nr:prepilin-type N-terminal cleavage/methylation domain-containing protein [Planctomycetota bacterium]